MTAFDASPEHGGLRGLIDSSPDTEVHTSAAAEAALLLGLASAVAAPFSLMLAATLGLAVPGLFLGLVGVAKTSRPQVAGRFLAPVGLVCCLAALVLVGVRYIGVDTAFGDDLLPVLADALRSLNARLPQP